MNATHKVEIISSWGRTVTPSNLKTLFEYPRPQMVRPPAAFVSLSSRPVGIRALLNCPASGFKRLRYLRRKVVKRMMK